ncbi:hypothetical protein QEN19_001489 [Hanseniaspora menglaensis]
MSRSATALSLVFITAILSTITQVNAGCQEISGNYYCNEVSAVAYQNIGYSGSYMDVTSMDESSCACSQSSYSFSGTNSPLDEQLSVHFRGPLNLKQFGVYYPSSSSSSKKRETGHVHKREERVPQKKLQERAMVVDVVEVYSTVLIDQNGNTITTSASAETTSTFSAVGSSTIETTSIATTTVVPSSSDAVSLVDENEFSEASTSESSIYNQPSTTANEGTSSSSEYEASSSTIAAVVKNEATTSSEATSSYVATTSSEATSSYVATTSSESTSSYEATTSSTSASSTSASSSSSSSSSTSSSSSSTGAWTRDSYYDAGSSADNVVFMNYYGGSGSGTWSSCFGNSLSYANSDASAGSSSSVTLDDTTIESDVEFIIFSGTECSDDNCGYYRSDTPAYEGFGGAEKIFVFEFGMPTSSTSSSSNDDMPAIWMLNAKIPRTLQYGNSDCSCWSTGCGELDLFEILSTGSDKLISHIHDGQGDNGSSSGGSGSSDYFDRPTSGTMKAAVIFSSDSSITIVKLDDSTTFGSSLDSDTVSSWLSTSGSVATNV